MQIYMDQLTPEQIARLPEVYPDGIPKVMFSEDFKTPISSEEASKFKYFDCNIPDQYLGVVSFEDEDGNEIDMSDPANRERVKREMAEDGIKARKEREEYYKNKNTERGVQMNNDQQVQLPTAEDEASKYQNLLSDYQNVVNTDRPIDEQVNYTQQQSPNQYYPQEVPCNQYMPQPVYNQGYQQAYDYNNQQMSYNQGYPNQQAYGYNQGYNNQQAYGYNQQYQQNYNYNQQAGYDQGYNNQQYLPQPVYNNQYQQNYNNQQAYGYNQGYANQQTYDYNQQAGYNNQQNYNYNQGYNNQGYNQPAIMYNAIPSVEELMRRDAMAEINFFYDNCRKGREFLNSPRYPRTYQQYMQLTPEEQDLYELAQQELQKIEHYNMYLAWCEDNGVDPTPNNQQPYDNREVYYRQAEQQPMEQMNYASAPFYSYQQQMVQEPQQPMQQPVEEEFNIPQYDKSQFLPSVEDAGPTPEEEEFMFDGSDPRIITGLHPMPGYIYNRLFGVMMPDKTATPEERAEGERIIDAYLAGKDPWHERPQQQAPAGDTISVAELAKHAAVEREQLNANQRPEQLQMQQRLIRQQQARQQQQMYYRQQYNPFVNSYGRGVGNVEKVIKGYNPYGPEYLFTTEDLERLKVIDKEYANRNFDAVMEARKTAFQWDPCFNPNYVDPQIWSEYQNELNTLYSNAKQRMTNFLLTLSRGMHKRIGDIDVDDEKQWSKIENIYNDQVIPPREITVQDIAREQNNRFMYELYAHKRQELIDKMTGTQPNERAINAQAAVTAAHDRILGDTTDMFTPENPLGELGKVLEYYEERKKDRETRLKAWNYTSYKQFVKDLEQAGKTMGTDIYIPEREKNSSYDENLYDPNDMLHSKFPSLSREDGWDMVNGTLILHKPDRLKNQGNRIDKLISQEEQEINDDGEEEEYMDEKCAFFNSIYNPVDMDDLGEI